MSRELPLALLWFHCLIVELEGLSLRPLSAEGATGADSVRALEHRGSKVCWGSSCRACPSSSLACDQGSEKSPALCYTTGAIQRPTVVFPLRRGKVGFNNENVSRHMPSEGPLNVSWTTSETDIDPLAGLSILFFDVGNS